MSKGTYYDGILQSRLSGLIIDSDLVMGDNDIILNNNKALKAKSSGGTAYNLLNVDAANQVALGDDNFGTLYIKSNPTVFFYVSGSPYARLTSSGFECDNLLEYTANAGILVDGAKAKDGSFITNISDVSASRAFDTVYRNTSGHLLCCLITIQVASLGPAESYNFDFSTDSSTPPTTTQTKSALGFVSGSGGGDDGLTKSVMLGIVQDDDYYEIQTTDNGGVKTIQEWIEFEI